MAKYKLGYNVPIFKSYDCGGIPVELCLPNRDHREFDQIKLRLIATTGSYDLESYLLQLDMETMMTDLLEEVKELQSKEMDKFRKEILDYKVCHNKGK